MTAKDFIKTQTINSDEDLVTAIETFAEIKQRELLSQISKCFRESAKREGLSWSSQTFAECIADTIENLPIV